MLQSLSENCAVQICLYFRMKTQSKHCFYQNQKYKLACIKPSLCSSAFKKKRCYCEGNIFPLVSLSSVLWFTCTAQSHSVWSKHILRTCISQPCFTYITLTITHQQPQLQSLGPPNASDQTSSHLLGVPNRGQHVTYESWGETRHSVAIQGLTDRRIQQSTP